MNLHQTIDHLTSLSGADSIRHSGRTLREHLLGCALTAQLLGLPDHIVLALAAHSVFGTSSFPGTPANRDEIHAVIGDRAFELVNRFSKLKRKKRWWLGVRDPKYSVTEWQELALIDIINLAEQV